MNNITVLGMIGRCQAVFSTHEAKQIFFNLVDKLPTLVRNDDVGATKLSKKQTDNYVIYSIYLKEFSTVWAPPSHWGTGANCPSCPPVSGTGLL